MPPTDIAPFVASQAPAVRYELTDEMIEATRERYAALEATTPKGYEEVRQAIAVVRGTRTSLEKRRVELKAEALDYGRRVDAEARRLTAIIESIEAPLVEKKQAVDDEKARIKAEHDAAKLAAIEARLLEERAAEEARLKAIRDVEEQRIAAERAQLEAERTALAEERRKADEATALARAAEEAKQAEQRERERVEREAEAARLRAEREALDRERQELEDVRRAQERVEFERKAQQQAEADAKARIEAERIADAEREARIAELLPDAKKLNVFAAALLAIQAPAVKSSTAKRVLAAAVQDINGVAERLTHLEKRA